MSSTHGMSDKNETNKGSDVILSLCMIVRDEESDLPDCLADASAVADEIVILDTGSTDRTVEIARGFGARVFHGTWSGDFAQARNQALEHCRGRWILSLDADERLDYVNGNRLLRAIRLAGEEVLAMALVIESEVGREGGEMLARHVFPRAFRNNPKIRWSGALHEQLVHSDTNILEHMWRIDVVVRHLGYARHQCMLGRRDRNADALDKETEADAGGEITSFQRLSAAHSSMNFGRFEEAVPILEELVDAGLPDNLDSTARWSLAVAYQESGRREETKKVLLEAQRRHPHHCTFRYLLAEIHLTERRPLEARALYESLLSDEQNHFSERTDLVPARSTMETQLARTYLAEGRPLDALRRLEDVLEREPAHTEGRFQRSCCLEALGRIEEAVSILEALSRELPDVPVVRERLDMLSGRVTRRHNPGLSVCVIARNEAENLASLIPSVSGLADEIVIVDTGSTDGTPDVARAAGATVVHHPWADNFSAARNVGLEAVSRRWVLWLDADERLAEEQHDLVTQLMNAGNVEGASLLLESPHQPDDPVECSRGRYCRFFRADLGVRFEGRVHEQILPALQRCGSRVVDSDIVVTHPGYALDPESMMAKKERNLRLLELSHQDNPNDFYTLFQIGTTLVAMQRFDEALRPLSEALKLGRAGMTREILLWTHLRLAQASFAVGEIDRCEAHARNALAIAPALEMGQYLLAAVWSRRNRPARSAVCLRRILRSDRPDPVAPMRRDEVEREFSRLMEHLSHPSAVEVGRP